MARLDFEDLQFEDKGEQGVKVRFYKNYWFVLDKESLLNIGDYKVEKHSISFDASEKSATHKFNTLLQRAFIELIGPNKRPTVYVHRNSGIPLIGSNLFGIVDRDTDILEIKPLTGCNLNCVYCSVDEGPGSKKEHDFIVEKEYLIQEFKNIAEKKKNKVEAHIAGHSEPLLYPKILELIRDLDNTGLTRDISIDTNGVLLSKQLVDELAKAGLKRINLSINSLDQAVAERMAGTPYRLSHVLEMARYIGQHKTLKLLIAPVRVPGMNEEEIPELIKLAKELNCWIGIQNYLEYDKGRKPAKQLSWEEFYALLDEYSKEYRIDLRMEKVFQIKQDKVLEKPFRKGDKVQAVVICPGKYAGEYICAAQGRSISIKSKDSNSLRINQQIKLEIVREKHNIYKARILRQ